MNENNYIVEDEITLEELILKIQEFWRELLSNWLLIGLISLPFALWFLYDAYTTPIKYKADLVFMINEDKGSGGGVAGLAGQLGLNVGGGGEYNKSKIISLSRSENITLPIILDSIEVKGVKDLIGNHIIRLYELRDKWKDSKNEELRNYLFTTNKIDSLTLIGNMVLRSCYAKIVGTNGFEALSYCDYDEDSGILNIESQSVSEELSYELANRIFTNLSTFYVNQQIEPQKKSYIALKARADSLNTLIRNKEYELANLQDSNNNIFLKKFKLDEARLKRQLPIYASQYSALLQNVEQADFILRNKTPFFQVVDKPFFPLKQVGVDKLRSMVIGGVLGVILAIIFVLGRKVFRDTMEE